MKRTSWILLFGLSCAWLASAQAAANPLDVSVVDLQALSGSVTTWQLPIIALLLTLLALLSLFVLASNRQHRIVTGSTFALLALVAGLSWFIPPTPSVTLSNPLTSKPDVEEARLLLQALLRNTYHAFTLRGESDVYDRLALSVTGEQLIDIYLQNRESLRIEEAEGRTMTIDDVRIVGSVERVERQRDDLVIQAEWYVIGSVSHWDHVHTRLNTYEAVVTLSFEDSSYKISDIDIIQQERTL